MGSMKELLAEMHEERARAWIAENHPDAEEGSEEWDAAEQEYGWFQDWLRETAEQQYFEISLASIPARLKEARAELRELSALLTTGQPHIVLRMALVHAVTILDSFLMYSARALLSHPDKLAAYLQHAPQLVRSKEDRKGLLDPKWSEQEPDHDTPANAYLWRAQAQVGRVTFQTERVIRDHFSVLLATPFDWPLASLKPVVTTRNDLVHRNGVTALDEPVTVWPGRVEHAIRCIHDIVEAAGATLLQEEDTIVAGWGVQPVPHHIHHPEGEQ